jgi:hemoglobin
MDEVKNTQPEQSLYLRVGGTQFFADLVDRFYLRVATDDLLRPLYPEDLSPGKTNLTAFLAQYWGGPTIYNETRGHPRLRMRHAAFPIGLEERNAWVNHMVCAVNESNIVARDKMQLTEYFNMAASSLVNR